MENNIELKNVSKEYPGFQLKDISFNVPKGSIVGLIGENGAGKTTTIKALLNIINYNGQIKIFNKDIKEGEKNIKQDLGIVLDDSFLSDYLTPKGINTIMKNLYPSWNSNKYFNYVKDFKLPSNKLIKNFSSGMKMKLKIITAISHNPKVLILDEPTSGLDPIIRKEILDLFRQYIAEDEERSILISSHITSDLEHISDYTIFINNGQIILSLPTTDLLENYGIVKCTEQEFKKLKKDDYITYLKGKYHYEILIKDKNLFTKKYAIKTIDKPSIDEIMLLYVKGEKL